MCSWHVDVHLHVIDSLTFLTKEQFTNFKVKFAAIHVFNTEHFDIFEPHSCKTVLQCHHYKEHSHLMNFLFFGHSLRTSGSQGISRAFFVSTAKSSNS